jgi:hypothetical protein
MQDDGDDGDAAQNIDAIEAAANGQASDPFVGGFGLSSQRKRSSSAALSSVFSSRYFTITGV